MAEDFRALDAHQGGKEITIKPYVIGLILSIVLTLAAYFIVRGHYLSGWYLFIVIVGLGFVQAIAQLLYFLHIGHEKKPHWNSLVFCFMVLFVGIVVLGTLWIMYNLDSRTMLSQTEMEEYMLHQSGIKKKHD